MTKRGAAAARRVDHAGPTWLEPMPIREWMQPAPATVRGDVEVGTAAELMRTRKIRHLPVVDADDRLVGIVTDRDLRQVVFDLGIQDRLGEAARGLDRLPVREVMTWGVVSVRPTTDLREAARLLHERKIGALPVTEGGKIVGILSEIDVLAALDQVLGRRLTGMRPLAGAPGQGEPYDYGFAPGALEDMEHNHGIVD
jgi:acetoin utilization protein AcuB